MSKRMRVCLRRWLWLASMPVGCVCAYKGPGLLINSLLHGYKGAGAAVLMLLAAGASAAICDWLMRGGL